MKRVYLLLRNNCQTGPYTIGELLQQQLKPLDLVWLEGSSQAWSYPGELPELNGFFEENKEDKQITAPIQPPGSLTKDEIEQWAEELRQRALSTPKIYMPATLDEDTTHIEALRVMARERIEFIDHRKKESPAFEWLSAAMVMLVVVGSVYGGASFFNARTNLPVVAHKMVTVDNHAAKVIRPIPQPVAAVYEEKKDTVAAPVVVKQKPVIIPRRKKINVEALPATAIERIPVPSHKEGGASSSSVPTLLDESQKETLIEPEPKAIVTEEPVEKKKSGLFRGLFRKKKKAEERATEQEAKAAESQGE